MTSRLYSYQRLYCCSLFPCSLLPALCPLISLPPSSHSKEWKHDLMGLCTYESIGLYFILLSKEVESIKENKLSIAVHRNGFDIRYELCFSHLKDFRQKQCFMSNNCVFVQVKWDLLVGWR